MKVSVALISLNDSSVLHTKGADYSSDEALGEVCGDLVAWARKNGHSAPEVSVMINFWEEFPEPLAGLAD